MQTAQALPTSEHFTLHPLAEGVYAAIATEGGAAYSNAGIVDLGDHTLVFDTFDNPKGAVDLRAAAEQLTGRPASYVVISHAHADHWMGNQVFDERTSIITTHAIREQMLPFVEPIQALKADPAELVNAIRENQERLAVETDERKRASLRIAISRSQHDLDVLPTLELRFADQTFEGKLVLHGTRRTVELITRGKGHTDSDCYLVLPADKVAFIGDLGFFASQPFMVYCDPQAWVAQLDSMAEWDAKIFVPGHGPLGTKADLALQKQYIQWMEDMIARVIRSSGSAEDALQQSPPAPLDAWLMGGMNRFEANVRSAHKRLSGQ